MRRQTVCRFYKWLILFCESYKGLLSWFLHSFIYNITMVYSAFVFDKRSFSMLSIYLVLVFYQGVILIIPSLVA